MHREINSAFLQLSELLYVLHSGAVQHFTPFPCLSHFVMLIFYMNQNGNFCVVIILKVHFGFVCT